MSEKLILDRLVEKGHIELKPEEHPDERAIRLRREERRDQREHLLFLVVLFGLSLIAVVTGYLTLLAEAPDPEIRKTAQTLFTTIASGGVGFLFGRVRSGR